jgi:glycosyltransferase involved in cell wall biosynthesis
MMRVPHDTHAAPLLGAYLSPGADAYYRLAVPLGAVGGVVAPFAEMTMSQVAAAETVVVSRYGAIPGKERGAVEQAKALRAEVGRLVVDFDDDLFNIKANVRHPHLNAEAAATLARQADALTCTNSFLAGRLRHLHRDIRVIPNYVRAADWPEPTEADGPVTLVLAGSHSHVNDWRVVAPALRRLKERHGVKIRVCGHCPDYLAPLADDLRPWASLDQYPAMLSGAHIGLCPLPTTGFNKAKTPIKAYEYALSGLAVVASPCQYGPVLTAAGLGAYVVGDFGDWYAPIERLVTSAEERRQAADALGSYVRTHLDVNRHAERIRAAYAA